MTFAKQLADEVASRLAMGYTQITMNELSQRLRNIGYRLDRSMDCKSVARWMTGARAGETYPVNSVYTRQIDDGKSACHFEARRDANFDVWVRLRNEVFCVSGGNLVEI
jgi:hypothetical protein